MAYDPNKDAPKDPAEIAFIAAILTAQGYWQGPPPALWDDKIEQALRKYQIAHNLSVSGRFDQATRSDMATAVGFAGGVTQDPVHQEVLTRYGPGIASMLGHPEIGPLLRQAAQEKWELVLLQENIAKTEWYRRQSDAQRTWEDTKLNNPGQADAQRREREAWLMDLATQMGVATSPQLIQDLAEDSLAFGWQENQTRDVLSSLLTFNPRAPEGQGAASVSVSQLKDYARQYLVGLTDQQAFKIAKQIASGETTLEAQVVKFKQQAKARFSYGGIGELIDRGITPEDYFSEHQRIVAQELEINQEAVDWMDPKWADILGMPDAKGVKRPLTHTETQRLIRTDERFGWDGTRSASQLAATLGRDLRSVFTGVR